jgi:hypothetical protein
MGMRKRGNGREVPMLCIFNACFASASETLDAILSFDILQKLSMYISRKFSILPKSILVFVLSRLVCSIEQAGKQGQFMSRRLAIAGQNFRDLGVLMMQKLYEKNHAVANSHKICVGKCIDSPKDVILIQTSVDLKQPFLNRG